VEFGPIITEQMKIRSGSNVYPSDEIYYVKADGTTPFILSFDGVLLGAARKDYQLNQMHFCMQKEEDQTTEGILKLMVPMRDVISAGNYRYATEETYMECEGTFFAETASFTEVRRSDFNKRVSATQAFCLDEEMSGERIFFFPGAGVVTQKNQVLSERQQDIENGIVLIADGEAPAILGFELPESLITEAEWKLDMNIVAEDKISGLQELRAEIYNQNNGEKRVLTDEDGDRILRFTISSEDELHWGQFAIAVYAKDNVGNEAVVSYGMDSLSVTAKVTNDIEPDRSVFKMGECGNLYVQAIGYAEEVEILFPKEWVEKNPLLNKRFTYSAPEAVHAENMEFMIPLQIEEGEYVIIVRAHKEGKVTEAKPELLTVKVGGSILNEIRTRLR